MGNRGDEHHGWVGRQIREMSAVLFPAGYPIRGWAKSRSRGLFPDFKSGNAELLGAASFLSGRRTPSEEGVISTL
jgi:hypothetical protein